MLQSPLIFDPLTRLQCCPPSCGAAAAVVCSEEFAKKHNLNTNVAIIAQSMVTDGQSTFDDHDMRKVVGYDMAKEASLKVYEDSGYGPKDIDVCELHDCFTTNELISYEALGLAQEGQQKSLLLITKIHMVGNVLPTLVADCCQKDILWGQLAWHNALSLLIN